MPGGQTEPRTETGTIATLYQRCKSDKRCAYYPCTVPPDSISCHRNPPKTPYVLQATSAKLRSRPSQTAPVVGILYPGHRIKPTVNSAAAHVSPTPRRT